MIEIPEAISLAKQIETELKGKTIKRITSDDNKDYDESNFRMSFRGKTIVGAQGYGGKLHIALTGNSGLWFADGINIRYNKTGKLPKKYPTLLIEFDDCSYLSFSVSLYGFFEGYTNHLEGWMADYMGVATDRPQVDSDEFSEEYFLELLKPLNHEKYTAKSFLATEQRIPGLGNGVLQDILFNAGISPKRSLSTMSHPQFTDLYRSIKNTIHEMIIQGGRDVDKDIYGKPGGYRTIMSRLTYKSPCLRCGSEIVRESYLGGNVYYCSSCQK